MAKETAIWQVQEFYRGEVLHDLVNQKESAIVEGHLMVGTFICASVRDKLPDSLLSGSLSAAYQNSETVTL